MLAKFTLNSTAKVIKKFGKDLSYIDPKTKKVTSFYKPSFTGNYMGFQTKKYEIVRLSSINSPSLSTLNEMSCKLCGSQYRVEMHHIRQIKESKGILFG
jgi:hypothetical protein